jgi:hypothetical protein
MSISSDFLGCCLKKSNKPTSIHDIMTAYYQRESGDPKAIMGLSIS